MSIVAERKRLLADRELRGSEFTLQLSDATDQWLQDLFSSVVDKRQDLALIAVGEVDTEGFLEGKKIPKKSRVRMEEMIAQLSK